MPCIDYCCQSNLRTSEDWPCLWGCSVCPMWPEWTGWLHPARYPADSSPWTGTHPLSVSRNLLHQALLSNEMSPEDTHCFLWHSLSLKPYSWRSLLTLSRVTVISVFGPTQLPCCSLQTATKGTCRRGRQEILMKGMMMRGQEWKKPWGGQGTLTALSRSLPWPSSSPVKLFPSQGHLWGSVTWPLTPSPIVCPD